MKKGQSPVYFSKVKEARSALAAKALALFEGYEALIKEAIANQEFEVAAQGFQYLLDHMPKDEEGITLLDPSVDKVQKKVSGGGPTIKIGIAVGGLPNNKELPPAVIDITPEDDDDDE